jgi:hypothetical protein
MNNLEKQQNIIQRPSEENMFYTLYDKNVNAFSF